jgi:hypothetical protein
MGCGSQEWFRNCADIRIVPKDEQVVATKEVPGPALAITASVCLAKNASAAEPVDCQTRCLRHPPDCPPELCHCVKDCRPRRADATWQDGLHCSR